MIEHALRELSNPEDAITFLRDEACPKEKFEKNHVSEDLTKEQKISEVRKSIQ